MHKLASVPITIQADPRDVSGILRVLRQVRGKVSVGDQIAGGLADKRKPSSFNQKSVRQGAKVEREHTSNPAMAKEIARDHLVEDPRYYQKLKIMEKHAMMSAFADELRKIGWRV